MVGKIQVNHHRTRPLHRVQTLLTGLLHLVAGRLATTTSRSAVPLRRILYREVLDKQARGTLRLRHLMRTRAPRISAQKRDGNSQARVTRSKASRHLVHRHDGLAWLVTCTRFSTPRRLRSARMRMKSVRTMIGRGRGYSEHSGLRACARIPCITYRIDVSLFMVLNLLRISVESAQGRCCLAWKKGGCIVWVIRGPTYTIVDCISGQAERYFGIAVMRLVITLSLAYCSNSTLRLHDLPGSLVLSLSNL